MGRELTRTVLNITIFFLVLFLYTKLAGPLPFSINSVTTTKSTTFDVTGEGKVSVKPDTATIQAGVLATGSTTSEAQNKINSIINNVSSSIKELGVDPKDIQTTNYSITPTYDLNQKITGYSANTTLTIKVKDIEKVNDVIDATTKAGANNVASLGFTTSERSEFENEARKNAVADAKKKAENAANIAGFRLGKLVNYSESLNGGPRPIPFALDKAESTSTNVEPGSDEIQVTVVLSYEIE